MKSKPETFTPSQPEWLAVKLNVNRVVGGVVLGGLTIAGFYLFAA